MIHSWFASLILTTLFVIKVHAGCTSTCTVPSLTTTTGSKAKAGPFCSGDLIFEDKFDTLDSSLWVPEVTMNGGGVRILKALKENQVTFLFSRIMNSKFTRKLIE